VASLRDQLTSEDEVIVCVDGTDADPRLGGCGVRVLAGSPGGPGAARNRGIDAARGRVLLFLNDDVVAGPGLIGAHLAAHADRAARGLGASMVVGAAPWAVAADDRVIDRLVRETSWIFFYDRMDGQAPEHDWGFRHAWTLNLSVPRASVERFDERLARPMFDDLEWAWRVAQRGAPVLFRPEASVTHEHRYTARWLLRREALLGHQAVTLRRVNPACAAATFGTRFSADATAAASARDTLPGVLPGAMEAFLVFEEAGAARARGEGSGVDSLFRASRGWREAARLAGYVGAMNGLDAGVAMAFAERRIAGASSGAAA
jgi:hypothetical protein